MPKAAPTERSHHPAPSQHGIDIASQRIDSLDRSALRFALSSSLPAHVALDLGCGLGVQGLRLAMLGCAVTLYDLHDCSARIDAAKELFGLEHVGFRQLDLGTAAAEDFPADTGIAYSQRFFHYLPHDRAARLCALLAARMLPSAQFFLSASGLNSELGRNYAHADRPLEERFATLDPAMQSKHAMREPVCLYTQDELTELVAAHGFAVVQAWRSPFGNIKAIFERI